jgi:nitrogen fixation/metabolism regulation signal transduction histidine kinase
MNRRKQKLTKSGLQLKLISAFLAMAVVAALFQVVLLNISLLNLTEDLGVQTTEVIARFSTILMRNLLITMGVLVPFMLVFGILITHRIAGPIYKFERYLESIARGEEQGDCKLRKGDELHDLCERLNTAVRALKQRGGEAGAQEAASEREAA